MGIRKNKWYKSISIFLDSYAKSKVYFMKVESRMVGVRGCGQVLNSISVMLRSSEFPLYYCIEEGL